MGTSRGSGQPPSKNGQRNGHNGHSGQASGPSRPTEGGSVERFYAELDRCWELMESGDLEGAQKRALKLLRTDGDSPELYVLLGMLAGMQGKPEQALDYYAKAMDIDAEYVEPIICAAEVYLWEMEEPEKALELCERALDLAEEEDEYVDALLLRAEAEVALDRDQAAYATLMELPELPLSEPSYHLRAGRLLLDLGHVDDAEDHFQRALSLDDQSADALHGLGLCAGERGDQKSMVELFLKVRGADLQAPPAPWALSTERFREVCSQAIDELPEELHKLLGNVPVIAGEYPSDELVKDGVDPRVLGLFTGVPYGDKSSVGGAPHLDAILLFQRNIERMAYNADDVENEIHITLVHEAGHFFGLSEEQLEEMGLG
jgi:predicted Zn-dependent protease with MMP-like domain